VFLGSGHVRVRLDDVLGDGWSVLGISVSEQDWSAIRHSGFPQASWVDVSLDDRSVRPALGRQAITDVDGMLQSVFAGHQRVFILVRPDRVVAAVFAPGHAGGVAHRLTRAGLVPARPRVEDRTSRPDGGPALSARSGSVRTVAEHARPR